MNYLSFCLIVKDEDEDNLLEWIEYHLSIGVEAFFIYDNESHIPVSSTLKQYIHDGVVTVFDCPGEHQQDPAYTHCLYFLGHTTRWLGFIDSDEFVVPKTNPDLKAFLEAYEPYAGLSINWLIFGSNGWEQKPPCNQTSAFIRYVPMERGKMDIVKCIVQPSMTINTLTPHEFLYKKDAFAVGEHFDRVEGPYRPFSVDKIQLNHYLLRSKEQFEKKIARGRSDHNRPYYQWDHFERINREATAIDHSILNVIQQVRNQHQRKTLHTIPPMDDVLPPHLFSPTQMDFAQYSRIAFEAKNSGDLETLAKVYQEAVRKYPELLLSRLLLFDALLQQAKITEALQTIQAAAVQSGKSSPKVLQREAKCLALIGQTASAIAAYQRLLEIEPDHEEALFWLAKLYLQVGKVESALACYDRLIQLNAWNQPAWESLLDLMKKYTSKDIHSTP